jgi:hypothetical protein
VLEKRKIYLEHPIKALGEHTVELRLHAQVTAPLKVRVESTTPVAAPAAAPHAAPGEGKESRARTESRGHRRAETVRSEGTAAPESAEAGARPERKPRAPKAEKPEKTDKPEKPEKPAKAEKSEKPQKGEKAEGSGKKAE